MMRAATAAGIAVGLIATILTGALVGAGGAHAQSLEPSAQTPHEAAAAAYSRLTPDQRIGQLFMTGVPSTGASAAQVAVLTNNDVGNVILIGATTHRRKTVRALTAGVSSALTVGHVAPFISTDQEGGEVQRLTGRGFSAMPTALKQGTLATSTLRADSTTWGHQLLRAGVDLDLAPVADTVPAKHAKRNLPIGKFDREFGHTPKVVGPHVAAFVRGMNAAGVDTTVKHFPGLGRASGNTDTTPGVTDPTTRHDPYLRPYQDGVNAGTPFVMVSSATYPAIDPHTPACFSAIVLTTMLRGDLGFSGVVVSDDLGTSALDAVPVGQRAIKFFSAGGTMLLDTTAAQIAAMTRAVRDDVAASPMFAAVLKSDELAVLLAKARAALITS